MISKLRGAIAALTGACTNAIGKFRKQTSANTTGLNATAMAATIPSWIDIAAASTPIRPSLDCHEILALAPMAPPNIDADMTRPDIKGAYEVASSQGSCNSVI